jgi:hypothetical protein
MGYTYNSLGLPVKSFNAYKYWQSGWIQQSRMVDLSPQSDMAYIVRMISSVDYDKNSFEQTETVLLRVDNTLYIKYNVAKGYDKDLIPTSSQKVAIVEASEDSEWSMLQAELELGDAFVYAQSPDYLSRIIKLCSIGTSPNDFAEVVVMIDDGSHKDPCQYTSRSTDITSPSPAPSLSDNQGYQSNFDSGVDLTSLFRMDTTDHPDIPSTIGDTFSDRVDDQSSSMLTNSSSVFDQIPFFERVDMFIPLNHTND